MARWFLEVPFFAREDSQIDVFRRKNVDSLVSSLAADVDLWPLLATYSAPSGEGMQDCGLPAEYFAPSGEGLNTGEWGSLLRKLKLAHGAINAPLRGKFQLAADVIFSFAVYVWSRSGGTTGRFPRTPSAVRAFGAQFTTGGVIFRVSFCGFWGLKMRKNGCFFAVFGTVFSLFFGGLIFLVFTRGELI